jgi:membrane fusion protein, multidrug efflux system
VIRNLVIRAVVIAFALVGAAAIVIDWNSIVWHGLDQTTTAAELRGDVTRLQARVSGYLAAVPVDDDQPVRKGDLLFQIEDDDYRARVEQAEAALDQAVAQRAQVDAQIGMAEAQVATAEANAAAASAELLRAQQERARQATLMSTAGGLPRLMQDAQAQAVRQQTNLASRQEAIQAEQRQVGVLQARRAQAEANIGARQAALDYARVELSYTRIVAPADGTVSDRLQHMGALVSPGTQLISFVPARDVWVIANYREEQLTNVRAGQPVRIHVDAFPGVTFHGHVDSIGPVTQSRSALLPPDRATGTFTKIVQRVPVKITFDPGTPDLDRLVPGLSVEPAIDTRGHDRAGG